MSVFGDNGIMRKKRNEFVAESHGNVLFFVFSGDFENILRAKLVDDKRRIFLYNVK